VVAGLRLDGLTAPAVFDRPIDNPTCRAYVEQVLVPALRRGDVVVLDNLAVHKQPKIRTAIEAAKRAPAISAAVQPGLQSDRTSRRETQSVSARRTAAIASLHRYEKRSSASNRIVIAKVARRPDGRRGRVRAQPSRASGLR
jgi:DDE superfamily endonuclease